MKDRQTALDEALAEVEEIALLDGEGGLITACQGPPICDRTFPDEMPDEERDALMQACPWCQRITVHADGSTTVEEPTRA